MKTNRRTFIRTSSLAGIGLLSSSISSAKEKTIIQQGKRVGIIGLDTSHSIAFTRALNNPSADPGFAGYKIVAAYPPGSKDIESSVSRIPGYIEEVKKHGVEIVESIEELLQKVDVVMLETNDGRLHLEQALPVFKAGKRMFIDKPIAASLTDTIAIFEASKKYNTPVFSASSLRYIGGTEEIAKGKIGKVIGADTYSPASLEKTHPDLFWYGVHGVETLFTVMGTGCKKVSRVFTENTDIVVGTWQDNRLGTFRGIRSGKSGFGGTVFGEKEIRALGPFKGYDPLLKKMVEFFNTGIPPFNNDETLEIFAFMEAADESRKKRGASVDIDKLMQKARAKANKIAI